MSAVVGRGTETLGLTCVAVRLHQAVPSNYFPAQNTSAARGGDCHQFRAFKESTTYGRIRTRNWLTVPSRHAVSPFATESN